MSEISIHLDFEGKSFWGKLWELRLLPFLILLWIYKRIISPVLPSACRHTPTCSVYTYQAIRQRGLIQGIVIGAWRVLRCNPWGTSGFDPVEAFRWPWEKKPCDCGHDHDEPEL